MFDINKCDYKVYSTQGGGYAKEAGNELIFIEAPEGIPSIQVGDTVPEEWSVVYINNLS